MLALKNFFPSGFMRRFGTGTNFPRKSNLLKDGRGKEFGTGLLRKIPSIFFSLLNDHFAGIGLCLMNG